MNTLLNETPHFEVATQAVDAVDAILTTEEPIAGVQISKDGEGFTYIGEDGTHVLGFRKRLEDSVFEYVLDSISPADGGGLSRATLRRSGYELFLRDQTEPLDESKVLKKIVPLGKLATSKS